MTIELLLEVEGVSLLDEGDTAMVQSGNLDVMDDVIQLLLLLLGLLGLWLEEFDDDGGCSEGSIRISPLWADIANCGMLRDEGTS